MAFIGYTAGIDAVLVLIALITLSVRQPKVDAGMAASKMAHFFKSYLVYMFFFLLLISVGILSTTGTTQGIVLILADIALWIALSYMVMISFIGSSESAKRVAMTILIILAALGSLYSIAKLAGILTDAGPLTWLFENMAPVLMYAVWIPVAIAFLTTAMRSSDSAVRMRSVMFALGLLLTTLSWVARLQLGVVSFLFIGAVSVVGFALLVGGVIYRAHPTMVQSQPAPAV